MAKQKLTMLEILDFWHFMDLTVPGVNYSAKGWNNGYKNEKEQAKVEEMFLSHIDRFLEARAEEE